MVEVVKDTIFIDEINVLTLIGILPYERIRKQKLQINLALLVDLSNAMHSDAIEDTLDYAALVKFVDTFADTATYQLLEGFAGGLLTALFSQFPVVQAIKLTIKKPGALQETRHVGLTLYRSR